MVVMGFPSVFEVVVVLCVCFPVLPRVECFHDGAPLYACEFMKPGTKQGGVTGDEGHTAQPQNVLPTYGNSKNPPYYIQLEGDPTHYTPGQSIQLSVIANQTRGSNTFRGVLLMAKPVTCASSASSPDTIEVGSSSVGSFVIPPTTVLKTIDCFGALASAVTHNSPQFKINETVVWKAPAHSGSGNVVFKATVVQDRTTFWLDLYSPILRDASVQPPSQCVATRLAAAETILTFGLTTICAIVLSTLH